MHRSPSLLVLLAALTSCTNLQPEGVTVRGSVWLVPKEEVRTAVAVARTHLGPGEYVSYVIVASRSELYVYVSSGDEVLVDGVYTPGCAVMRKERGRWRYVGDATSPGIPF